MRTLIAITVSCLVLSSCTGGQFRRGLGIDKHAPDEFSVIAQPDLKIPKTFDLPVPQDKVISRIDTGIRKKAEEKIIGNRRVSGISDSERELLSKVDANTANIRNEIDKENVSGEGKGVFGVEKGGMLDSILDPFGYNSPSDPVINADDEKKRIQENIKKGKAVNEGNVEVID
jgi:hypothetical protein